MLCWERIDIHSPWLGFPTAGSGSGAGIATAHTEAVIRVRKTTRNFMFALGVCLSDQVGCKRESSRSKRNLKCFGRLLMLCKLTKLVVPRERRTERRRCQEGAL